MPSQVQDRLPAAVGGASSQVPDMEVAPSCVQKRLQAAKDGQVAGRALARRVTSKAAELVAHRAELA